MEGELTSSQAELLLGLLLEQDSEPRRVIDVAILPSYALMDAAKFLLGRTREYKEAGRQEAAAAGADTVAELIATVQRTCGNSDSGHKLVQRLSTSLSQESLAAKPADLQRQVLCLAGHLAGSQSLTVELLLGAVMLADTMRPGWACQLLDASKQRPVTLAWLASHYLSHAVAAMASSARVLPEQVVQLHAAAAALGQVACDASREHYSSDCGVRQLLRDLEKRYQMVTEQQLEPTQGAGIYDTQKEEQEEEALQKANAYPDFWPEGLAHITPEVEAFAIEGARSFMRPMYEAMQQLIQSGAAAGAPQTHHTGSSSSSSSTAATPAAGTTTSPASGTAPVAPDSSSPVNDLKQAGSADSG